jgi:hypothetical protein
VISGRIVVRMDDGSESEFGPGDMGSIPPGHDAWIIGNEPFISIDFPDCRTGLQYNRSRRQPGRTGLLRRKSERLNNAAYPDRSIATRRFSPNIALISANILACHPANWCRLSEARGAGSLSILSDDECPWIKPGKSVSALAMVPLSALKTKKTT